MDRVFNKLVALISFACLLFFGPFFMNTAISKPFIVGIPASYVLLFLGWFSFIVLVAYIVQKSRW